MKTERKEETEEIVYQLEAVKIGAGALTVASTCGSECTHASEGRNALHEASGRPCSHCMYPSNWSLSPGTNLQTASQQSFSC